MGYARLYDGTAAADYYRAMGQVERWFQLPEGQSIPASAHTKLLALLDTLQESLLDKNQRMALQALKEGIIALAVNQTMDI